MIQSLQVLRGWAAILVVWYHCHTMLVKRSGELGYTEGIWTVRDHPLAKFGAIGVDIFFILSGFIIFYTTWHASLTWREFAVRRWIRIYPLWWAALALTCSVALIPGATESFTWLELVYSTTLIPYFSESGELKPIIEVGWTLNYEILFYLVFSLFIALNPMKRLLWVTVVFALTVLIGRSIDIDSALLSVASNPKTLEFVSGGWLAYWYIRGARTPGWVFGVLLGALAIMFAGFMTSEAWRVFGGKFLGIRYWMALITLYLALFYGPLVKRQFGKLSLLLGDASYSIYLFHSLALTVASGLWKRDFLVPPDWVSPWLLWGALVTAVCVYGVLVHLIIERPLLAWCRQRLIGKAVRKPRPQPAVSLPDQGNAAALKS